MEQQYTGHVDNPYIHYKSPYAGSVHVGGLEGECSPRTFLFSTRRGLRPRLVEKRIFGETLSPQTLFA
jgi:hypothetical protein